MTIRDHCDWCKEERISQPYTLPFIKNVACWNRDFLVTEYQEICPFTVFLCDSCAKKIAKRINPEGEEND